MRELRDRVAVVTGGASGIGFATAGRFAAEGMRLVLADVEAGALELARKELEQRGARVLAVRTDVSRAEEVEALAQRALEHFGAVHVVFNNAGVAVTGAAWESSLADWEWVLGVNLWGVIHGIRTFVPILLRQGEPGHVVSTASMAGLLSNPGMAVYNVTKFGVVTLSETLKRDLAAQNARVGVSVLCPGFTHTRIMDSARNRAGSQRKDPPSPEPSELGAAIELALRRGVDSGISPADVAGWVVDAIREDRFYVMPPGPEVAEGIRARMEDLLARRNPGPMRLLQET